MQSFSHRRRLLNDLNNKIYPILSDVRERMSFIVSLYLSWQSLHSFFKRFVFLNSIKSNVLFIANNCRCYSTNDWSNFPTRQSLLFASCFIDQGLFRFNFSPVNLLSKLIPNRVVQRIKIR